MQSIMGGKEQCGQEWLSPWHQPGNREGIARVWLSPLPFVTQPQPLADGMGSPIFGVGRPSLVKPPWKCLHRHPQRGAFLVPQVCLNPIKLAKLTTITGTAPMPIELGKGEGEEGLTPATPVTPGTEYGARGLFSTFFLFSPAS